MLIQYINIDSEELENEEGSDNDGGDRGSEMAGFHCQILRKLAFYRLIEYLNKSAIHVNVFRELYGFAIGDTGCTNSDRKGDDECEEGKGQNQAHLIILNP